MSKPLFRVIIVSWNVKNQLTSCLRSLASLSFDKDYFFEVVVVDNASSDGTVEMVKNFFPWVKLIIQKKNIGFAKACNLAAVGTEAEYILLLNPDTQVTAGFFSDLYRSFIRNKKIAIIGPHIINPDGTTQRSVRGFPNMWVGLLLALKLLDRMPRLAPKYFLPDFDYLQPQPVEQVMGACLAIRTDVWHRLGGFDESFYLWFEEVDLCKRVWQIGYEVWYEPKIIVSHEAGVSFAKLSKADRHNLFISSLVYYLKKHKGLLSAVIVWLLAKPSWIFLKIYDFFFCPKTYKI